MRFLSPRASVWLARAVPVLPVPVPVVDGAAVSQQSLAKLRKVRYGDGMTTTPATTDIIPVDQLRAGERFMEYAPRALPGSEPRTIYRATEVHTCEVTGTTRVTVEGGRTFRYAGHLNGHVVFVPYGFGRMA